MTPLTNPEELVAEKLFSSDSAPLISQTLPPDPMPQSINDLRQYIASHPIDLLVVPGLSFHPPSGTRLGKGGGFYDQFIALSRSLLSPPPAVIGVCFSTQIVQDPVPCTSFDQHVEAVFFAS